MLKLKNGFLQMSDSKVETRASQILTAMNGNVNFVNPKPSVAEMQLLVSAYSAALSVCTTGDRLRIAEKNQKRAALVDALHQWSYYVLLESNGDEAKAVSSGFEVAPDPAARPPLAKPKALVITNGVNSGELICKGKPVAGATGYLFEYTTLEGLTSNQWSSIPSTRTKQVIASLTRGTLYYCRIGALGVNNQLVYSDVTTRTAA